MARDVEKMRSGSTERVGKKGKLAIRHYAASTPFVAPNMDDAELGSAVHGPQRCLDVCAATGPQRDPSSSNPCRLRLNSPPRLHCPRCSLVWLTSTGRRATPWVHARMSQPPVVAVRFTPC